MVKKHFLRLLLLLLIQGNYSAFGQTVTAYCTGTSGSFKSGSVTSAGVLTDNTMTSLATTTPRGWAVFNLAALGIPYGAVVTSSSFIMNISTISGSGTPTNSLYGIASDLSTLAVNNQGTSLYSTIPTGTVINTTAWNTVAGSQTLALTAAGNSFLQNNLSNTISIGLGVLSGSRIYSITGWGGTSTTQPRLSITYTVTPCSGTPAPGTAAAPATVCASNNFNLTLTGNTYAGGITIQWQFYNTGTSSWQNIAGATTAVYTVVGGITVQTQYRALVTCTGSGLSSTSNTVTVNPTPSTPATISITGNNSVCAGTSVTYTATTNVTGGTIQWKVNGINVGTNSTTYSYVPTNGNVITATVTSGSVCFAPNPQTSNAITMTVTGNTAPTISISGSNSVCSGVATTYTATTNVVGGTYQWKVNSVNVGTNSPTYSHSATSNFTIQCVITATTGCYSPITATSSSLAVTVNPFITPTINVTSNANNICDGASVVFTAAANITGGSYQWKVNGGNVGTNSTTYNYVPADNDQISCVLTNPATGCFTANNTVSNPVAMAVIPNQVPTVSIVVDTNTNVCYGMPVTFTATTNVANGSYQWKVNNFNLGNNSATFIYVPANSEVVTCEVTKPVGACFVPASATSNAITMQVIYPVAPSISIGGTTNVCKGATTIYTAVTNVPVASFTWKVNNNVLTTTNSSFSYVPANNDVIKCYVTVLAGCYTKSNDSSAAVTISEKTIPTPAMITGTNMFYSNYPTGNKWFRNDTLIASSLVLNLPQVVSFPSCYHLHVTNPYGCAARTADTCMMPVNTGITQLLNEAEVQIYPNPSSDVFYINSPAENGDYYYEIADMTGRKLQGGVWKVTGNKIEEKVSVISYSDGMYFLTVRNERSRMVKKIEKR